MSLFKIGSNTQSMNALRSLYNTNAKIGVHQARLSSGKRINSAQDDTAGYAIANSLKSRASGLKAALNNVTNAQAILTVAEGGFQAQMDILQTIKDKTIQVVDGSLNQNQRDAIYDQISELEAEIGQIQDQTKWSGSVLIAANGSTTDKTFHVGADSTDTLTINIGGFDEDSITLTGTSATAQASDVTVVDNAINTLAGHIQDVGDKLARLSSKEDALGVSVTNTEAVRSTYEDADFAKEQMEIMKMQILQQTAVAALSQANAMPQVVLSLFK